MNIVIRPETSADHEAIRHVNRLAFGQDDEARLVDALREGGHVRLSLVADQLGRVVGHILFSDLPIHTDRGVVAALALAPMSVLPEFQKQGIGSALVREGLDECRRRGHKIVVVVGHPHFYPRFGFSPQLAAHLESPFSGRDSFMAVELEPGALDHVSGKVAYPPPFEGVPAQSLVALDGVFAVCRLGADASIPPWASAGRFFSITRTADELSIVCRAADVPEGVVCERGYRCLRVAGTIPLSAVGVLASLTAPLSAAGISVFAVSTFDTDYLLVKEDNVEAALGALRRQGHAVG
jgi:putative acetyltransferase